MTEKRHAGWVNGWRSRDAWARECHPYADGTLLAVLAVLGAWLRIRHLGALGFIADEGIQALAVQAVLEHGLPILESGMLYVRAPLFLYVQAGIAALADLNEFWMRLPSAFWGAAVVLPTYLLGKELFDRYVGLLAALIVAFSSWEIEMARYARFYTQFQFFFLTAVLFFYRGFLLDDRLARWGFVLATAGACLSHQLGQLLLVLFAVPLVRTRGGGTSHRVVLGWASGLAAGVVGYRLVVPSLQSWIRPLPVAPEHALASSSRTAGLFEDWALMLGVEGVDLPTLEPLLQVADQIPVVLVLLGILGAVVSIDAGIRMVRHPRARHLVVPALAVWLAILHQIGLAVLVGLFYLIGSPSSVRRLSAPQYMRLWAPVPLIFLIWASTLRWGLDLSVRTIVDTMFGFPNLLGYLFKWLVPGWPLMTVLLLLGSGLLMVRFLYDRGDREALSMLGALYLPAIAASLFESHAESRYLFHLYPLIVLIFVWTVWRFTSGVADRWTSNPAYGLWGSIAVTVPLLLVMSQDANPIDAWRIGERTYESSKRPERSVISWWRYDDYHQDYESPSRYVRDRISSEDRVLLLGNAIPVANVAYYLGRVDYVLDPDWSVGASGISPVGYIDDEGRRTYYLADARVVTDLAELRRATSGTRGTLWIVGDRHLLERDSGFYPEPLASRLRDLVGDPDFVGRDGQSFVAALPSDAEELTQLE